MKGPPPPDAAGFVPGKSRGQNFLVDPNLARKLVAALGASPGDRVLEIGPGKGALTGLLLEAGARVDAVEIQDELAHALSAWGRPGLTVHHADFLQFAPDSLGLASGETLDVLSNVPYSISGPLLARLLGGAWPGRTLVLGLQREVAERLAAPPGGKDFGSLTVMARAFGRVEKLFKIPGSSYRPRPRVESMAIRIRRDPTSPWVELGSWLERVVRAGFSMRRKTVRNSLSGGLGQDPREVEARLMAAGIDPGVRAETLDVPAWRKVAEVLDPSPGRAPAGTP